MSEIADANCLLHQRPDAEGRKRPNRNYKSDLASEALSVLQLSKFVSMNKLMFRACTFHDWSVCECCLWMIEIDFAKNKNSSKANLQNLQPKVFARNSQNTCFGMHPEMPIFDIFRPHGGVGGTPIWDVNFDVFWGCQKCVIFCKHEKNIFFTFLKLV